MAKQRIMLGAQSKALTLQEGFDLFIKTKEAENLSERSIKFYRHCFQYFTAYFNEKNFVLK